VLERARRGRFSDEDARTAPAASLERWFSRADGGWRAGAELSRTLTFEHADLLSMRVPRESYDLVFCRNVVIYFNEDVRDRLHARLAESLRSGAYLVVGATERVSGEARSSLTLARPFMYRKV
jgi:chemotaxis protein methyltransferase CheR